VRRWKAFIKLTMRANQTLSGSPKIAENLDPLEKLERLYQKEMQAAVAPTKRPGQLAEPDGHSRQDDFPIDCDVTPTRIAGREELDPLETLKALESVETNGLDANAPVVTGSRARDGDGSPIERKSS